MTIEIANRLVELRKKSGLSQEELADKLGISRQSVSKWERAESSPDTDNLICLAKIYGVSLDELLSSDQEVEEIAKDKKEQLKEDLKTIEKHLEEKDEDDKEEKHKEYRPEWKKRQKIFTIIGIIDFSLVIAIVAIVHIILTVTESYENSTMLLKGWWVNYFLAIVISSLGGAIGSKKWTNFAFPILALYVFLFIGMYFAIWSPTWIVFILIPIYYGIAGPIDNLNKDKRRKEKFLD